MFDTRVTYLAGTVLKDSCRLQAGERVLMESVDVPIEVIKIFLGEARTIGAHPFSLQKRERLMREIALSARPDDMQLQADFDLEQLSRMQAHVLIRRPLNGCEMWDVPQEQLNTVLANYVQRVHYEYRNRELRFVTLRWPSLRQAERAGMSTSEFEDFFFDACLVDYKKLAKDLDPLVQLMQKTIQVRIKGPGDTNLSVSIKGLLVSKDIGERHLPDGEVSTAPIKESVNGRIRYNLPVIFYGRELRNIVLDFRQGRVESMSCQNQEALERLLNQDQGARYVGEFALGATPYINRPVKDILFDEKINGTLHLAQGSSYGIWNNGNKSSVHLDFILRQTEKYGGGEVTFDDNVIHKDGWFVLNELQHLNLKSVNYIQDNGIGLMDIIDKRIKEVVADTLGLPLQKITDDLTMKGAEEWDSLKHMELVAAIEDCFAFELSFDEIVNMVSISGIQKVVAAKLSGDGK